MSKWGVAAAAVVAAALGCSSFDSEKGAHLISRGVLCYQEPSAARPYPRVVYGKYGEVCKGYGGNRSKSSEYFDVTCRLYDDADATGLIKVATGTVDDETRDCVLKTGEAKTEVVTRDDGGAYVTYGTVNGAQSGETKALVCEKREHDANETDADCGESARLTARIAEAAVTAAGVQGACVDASQAKRTCTEYFGLSDAQLAEKKAACAAWSDATSCTDLIEPKAGCVKSPAQADAPGSKRQVWLEGLATVPDDLCATL